MLQKHRSNTNFAFFLFKITTKNVLINKKLLQFSCNITGGPEWLLKMMALKPPRMREQVM